MVYDSIIIGSGPAGVSAALTLKANNLSFLFIGSRNLSEKVGKAELISNYPGLLNVTGKEMNEAFMNQCESLGIEITDKMVTSIMKMGDNFMVMAGEDFFEASSIILATGVIAVGTLPKESELLGLGVSYCATCDGNLYRGKTIAILSSSKRFEHEVEYLSAIAKKVYFTPLYGSSSLSLDNLTTLDKRIVSLDEKDGYLSGIILNDGEKIEVDGLFCLRDSVSLTTLMPGLETKDNHISVNRNMETNIEGCFACGDCTGRPYQYVKAAGEGNVAAHSVISYLSIRK